MEEGYYTGGTIGTTLNPVGKVTYDHHIHDLSSADIVITNEDSSKSSVSSPYPDDYESPTRGGCFQTEHVEVHKHTSKKGLTVTSGCWEVTKKVTKAKHSTYYDCGYDAGAHTEHRTCPSCGSDVAPDIRLRGDGSGEYETWWNCTNTSDTVTYSYKLICGKAENEKKIYYTRSCNHEAGAVVEAHIKY